MDKFNKIMSIPMSIGLIGWIITAFAYPPLCTWFFYSWLIGAGIYAVVFTAVNQYKEIYDKTKKCRSIMRIVYITVAVLVCGYILMLMNVGGGYWVFY